MIKQITIKWITTTWWQVRRRTQWAMALCPLKLITIRGCIMQHKKIKTKKRRRIPSRFRRNLLTINNSRTATPSRRHTVRTRHAPTTWAKRTSETSRSENRRIEAIKDRHRRAVCRSTGSQHHGRVIVMVERILSTGGFVLTTVIKIEILYKSSRQLDFHGRRSRASRAACTTSRRRIRVWRSYRNDKNPAETSKNRGRRWLQVSNWVVKKWPRSSKQMVQQPSPRLATSITTNTLRARSTAPAFPGIPRYSRKTYRLQRKIFSVPWSTTSSSRSRTWKAFWHCPPQR